MKPLLAITMGDATGSGPEIIVKSFEDGIFNDSARLFVIGDLRMMQRAARIVRSAKSVRAVDLLEGIGEDPDFIDVLSLDNLQEQPRKAAAAATGGESAAKKAV